MSNSLQREKRVPRLFKNAIRSERENQATYQNLNIISFRKLTYFIVYLCVHRIASSGCGCASQSVGRKSFKQKNFKWNYEGKFTLNYKYIYSEREREKEWKKVQLRKTIIYVKADCCWMNEKKRNWDRETWKDRRPSMIRTDKRTSHCVYFIFCFVGLNLI